MPVDKISIKDWMEFFDKSHTKVGKKDTQRRKLVIEKHRHDDIHRIVVMTYHYANAYEGLNVFSPFNSIDYSQFPYYNASSMDADWYSFEDVKKLLETFDSIENPSLPILAVGAIFETNARNGEVRALRFSDFHFDDGYVRICGLSDDSIRNDRIKADSDMGMRNVTLTDRLKTIYQKAKELSWSDEFPFVRERSYVDGEKILMTEQAVQRALKKLCSMAGIKYLPPHQIRFANATRMAQAGRRIEEIQRFLGHTTPTMSMHYIRNYQKSIPISGPSYMTQADAQIKKPQVL